MKKEIVIKNVKIGNNNPLVLIAGPCVIETQTKTFIIARKLKKITSELGIPFIFKASYDKANRTSIKSFRGPGLQKGLDILKRIKKDLDVPILTDVHERQHVHHVARIVDILQIPAYLCRQTDLVLECARTSKPINIKKGQFLAPWDVKNIIDKAESAGNRNILITERGTCFGYNNLVVDMRSLVIMRSFNYPVVFDGTHSVQLPGGYGTASSGQSEFAGFLACGAAGIGIDALFLEVHPDPDSSPSDGSNMLKLDNLAELLERIIRIDKAVKC